MKRPAVSGEAQKQSSGILFDAYGTLFDVYSLSAVAEAIFPGQGSALARLWRDKQLEYSRLRTLSDRYADFLTVTKDALRYSCERLRLVLSEAVCASLISQYRCLSAFPEVNVVVTRLHAHGIPLAILSNGTADMLASAISAGGMSGLFSHVLSADLVRKFKTAPEIYQLGVDAFGCPAEQLLFVSSNGWDACCATWFGYRTFWINRGAEPIEHLGVSPSGQGSSLDDLLHFVGVY
jgi:2-haloacid dehalogenase